MAAFGAARRTPRATTPFRFFGAFVRGAAATRAGATVACAVIATASFLVFVRFFDFFYCCFCHDVEWFVWQFNTLDEHTVLSVD